jgi:glycosyltransferase involved in cell wall biosynthesis
MKFSIITPTHKRRHLLERSVASVLAQTHHDWEMIIVNDSPFDEAYADFALSIKDQRIRYYKNETNKGKNYSCNLALDKVSADSKWVIFLDDDDYFAPDALSNFANLILLYSENKWFVTNRAEKNGTPFTRFPKDETLYSYAWSYLILKRCKGDATHCIETKLITELQARFSQYVKQGEEWFFFYQLGRYTKMFYSDHNSTISDGYDQVNGLNFRKRPLGERFESLIKLFYEGGRRGLSTAPSFLLYIMLRSLKAVIK